MDQWVGCGSARFLRGGAARIAVAASFRVFTGEDPDTAATERARRAECTRTGKICATKKDRRRSRTHGARLLARFVCCASQSNEVHRHPARVVQVESTTSPHAFACDVCDCSL